MAKTKPRRRCKATAKSTGRQCRRTPILGGAVCPKHGGDAPQVRAAANLRLARLVDPAIDTLVDLTRREARRKNPAVALGAANSVLDRAGHPKTNQVSLGGSVTLIDPEQVANMTDDELELWDRLMTKLRKGALEHAGAHDG